MNITNDFVTVEFNTEEEEKIARRCMKLLESHKELYKKLLKGKNLISCESIYNRYDELDKTNEELSDIRFKYFVDSYIEEENSAEEGVMIPEYNLLFECELSILIKLRKLRQFIILILSSSVNGIPSMLIVASTLAKMHSNSLIIFLQIYTI